MLKADNNTEHIVRDKKTVHKIIQLYCHKNYRPEGSLCPECQDILAYAIDRIDHCPYENEKPTCVNCPIHCYRPNIFEKIRQVMRNAGPRTLFRHPLLTDAIFLTACAKPLNGI